MSKIQPKSIAASLCIIIAALIWAAPIHGQRRITPVTPTKGVNQNALKNDRSHLKEALDGNGNIVLIDTITGSEYVDTTATSRKVVGNIYPLMHSVSLGVNLWDGAMRALGQHYGLGSARVELSLHNRYKPFFEVGLSMADDTPDGLNYTFKSPMAPYFKLGFNYNVFYNSNPDYQLCAGIRYGLTNFSYRYDDIHPSDDYWNENESFAIPSQRTTAGYLELALGIKVKIAGPISLGWDILYHSRLHESRNAHGPAMIIPGYGKREGSFSAALLVYYTLPLKSKKAPKQLDSESPYAADDYDDEININ